MSDYVRESPHGAVITVRVSPSASKTGIAEISGEMARIRIAAPPVDGKANGELVKFLAKLFKVPKSFVEIVGGETGKLKRVLVRGVSPEKVRHKFEEGK